MHEVARVLQSLVPASKQSTSIRVNQPAPSNNYRRYLDNIWKKITEMVQATQAALLMGICFSDLAILFHRTLFDCNGGSDGAHRQNYPIVQKLKFCNFVRANESAQCEIKKHFVHAFAERPVRISVTFLLFSNPYMTSNRYCIRIFATSRHKTLLKKKSNRYCIWIFATSRHKTLLKKDMDHVTRQYCAACYFLIEFKIHMLKLQACKC